MLCEARSKLPQPTASAQAAAASAARAAWEGKTCRGLGASGDMIETIVAAGPRAPAAPPMPNIDELKSTGLKATGPRLKILEVFHRGDLRHMTAEDVYRILLQE